MQKFAIRLQTLETKMEYIENSAVKEIKADLRQMKQNQLKMFENIVDFRAHTDNGFIEVERRISDLKAHNDFRLTELHKEITGIKGDNVAQTRWILLAILSTGTLISVIHPLVMKLL